METERSRRAVTLASLLVAAGVVLASRDARAEERPFTFTSDAQIPTAWHVDALYRGTWGMVGTGAVRAIGASDFGVYGSVQEVGAEVGLWNVLSVRGYGLAEFGLRNEAPAYATAGAEVRARVVGWQRGAPFQLTLAAGALREFNGFAALQFRVTASGTIGPVRLTTDITTERSFRPRADALDLLASAGASVRVMNHVRVGAEYLVQDVESLWISGELEGLRQMVGPSAAFAFLGERLQVTSGVAFGTSALTPPVTVRLAAAYTF